MKQNTVFVSGIAHIIKYENIKVTLPDLLKWKDELSILGVDLYRIIIIANRDLFSAFQRCLLDYGISQIRPIDSIIPFTSNQIKIPVEEKIEFVGLNVYEEEKIVMKVYVYETYNN